MTDDPDRAGWLELESAALDVVEIALVRALRRTRQARTKPERLLEDWHGVAWSIEVARDVVNVMRPDTQL